jgi:SAM-dependent methyltransferase
MDKFKVAQFFIKAGHRLGPWVQNLPAAFLSAEELSALTRRYYDRSHVVEAWKQNASLRLTSAERLFLKRYARGRSRALVLGCGAGREALALARRGMRVTAVDYSPFLLEALREKARREELDIDTIEADYLGAAWAKGDVFDLVFLGLNYGAVPSRPARVAFLKKVKFLMKDDARLFLSFLCRPRAFWSAPGLWFHRFCALLCRGHRGVEIGDEIRGEGEFLHHFTFGAEVFSEVRDAGLTVDTGVEKEGALFLKSA